MLEHRSFRYKIMVIPGVSLFTALTALMITAYFMIAYAPAVVDVQTHAVPAARMIGELKDEVQSMQRTAQQAVATGDMSRLDDLAVVRERARDLVEVQRGSPLISDDAVTQLRTQVDAYGLSLERTSRTLIQFQGESEGATLDVWSPEFDVIQSTLETSEQQVFANIGTHFDTLTGAAIAFGSIIGLIASGISVILVGLSYWVVSSLSAPLSSIATSADAAAVLIVSTVQEQSTTLQETATSISEASTTVDELRQASEMASRTSQEVMSAAQRSLVTAEATVGSVQRGIAVMDAIRAEVTGIAREILELSEKHLQIGEIVESVSAIAEQSNLLAVNASIEAAKAGEAGRGFAVVATEVNALAEKSKEATREIRALLAEIQKSSNATVMVTEQGTKRVEEGSEVIARLGQSVEEFREVLEESAEMGRKISLATEQQQMGLEQIGQAMRTIEDASKSSASGARQLEHAASEVQMVSSRVVGIVEGEEARERNVPSPRFTQM